MPDAKPSQVTTLALKTRLATIVQAPSAAVTPSSARCAGPRPRTGAARDSPIAVMPAANISHMNVAGAQAIEATTVNAPATISPALVRNREFIETSLGPPRSPWAAARNVGAAPSVGLVSAFLIRLSIAQSERSERGVALMGHSVAFSHHSRD